jgi:hypothetical protein
MKASMHIPVDLSFTVSTDPDDGSFHELQRNIRREARRALARGLVTALEQMERRLVETPVLCPQCDAPMRSRGRTPRRVVTVFGPLDVQRRRYHCTPCRTVRRPLDEWLGLVSGTEFTAAVREQALYLAADLPYERAAEVLRHIGGIGMSGRQIQLLLEDEARHIEAEVGRGLADASSAESLRRRFRRQGRGGSAGADRLLQLRRLKTSGLWDAYWARRFEQERSAVPTAEPSR